MTGWLAAVKPRKTGPKLGTVKGILPTCRAGGCANYGRMLMIGWTTVETREQAETLARGLIEQKLAACVQIEGPITSVYRWKGRLETATEFRLCVKFLPEQQTALAAWIAAHHPYETPEWIAVRSEIVAEKYLSWAKANSSS
jgi:periplasmic divalent cation tolerance protein